MIGFASGKVPQIPANHLLVKNLSVLGLYWGDAAQNIPLPGGCALLINPIWGTFHTSSATGTFSWNRTWPHWATARFYMQMGTLEIMPNGSWSALTTECQIGQCW